MNRTEQWVRATNPTQRRLHLMANGWTRGRNQNDWQHPDHPGSHTLAAATRIALGTEGR